MRGGDRGVGVLRQAVVVGGREAQYGDGSLEKPRGHEGTQCQDVLALAENQRLGRSTGKSQTQEHTTSGARAATRRHHHDMPGQSLPLLRVMRVNDPSAQRINTAPDTQPLVAEQDRPLNLGGDNQVRHEITLC